MLATFQEPISAPFNAQLFELCNYEAVGMRTTAFGIRFLRIQFHSYESWEIRGMNLPSYHPDARLVYQVRSFGDSSLFLQNRFLRSL